MLFNRRATVGPFGGVARAVPQYVFPDSRYRPAVPDGLRPGKPNPFPPRTVLTHLVGHRNVGTALRMRVGITQGARSNLLNLHDAAARFPLLAYADRCHSQEAACGCLRVLHIAARCVCPDVAGVCSDPSRGGADLLAYLPFATAWRLK